MVTMRKGKRKLSEIRRNKNKREMIKYNMKIPRGYQKP
jgi:hypothetical protein